MIVAVRSLLGRGKLVPSVVHGIVLEAFGRDAHPGLITAARDGIALEHQDLGPNTIGWDGRAGGTGHARRWQAHNLAPFITGAPVD